MRQPGKPGPGASPSHGSDARPLEKKIPGQIDEPGAFTPDGSQLAFTRQPNSIQPTIMVMPSDGGAARTLLKGAQEPTYSPDGRLLAYDSARDRNGTLNYGDIASPATELYVANADSSAPRRLTATHDINENLPSWSPDGGLLAFQRGEVTGNAEGTGVWTVSPSAGTPQRLIADPKLDTWYAAA